LTESVAQKIRDDLIAQDIRYRRADAGVRQEVNERLDELDSQIVAAVIKIDVAGTSRVAARRRRLEKLNREIGDVTRRAFSDINNILKLSLRRIAKVEARKVNQIVEENLP
jgi:hypothetical protein